MRFERWRQELAADEILQKTEWLWISRPVTLPSGDLLPIERGGAILDDAELGHRKAAQVIMDTARFYDRVSDFRQRCQRSRQPPSAGRRRPSTHV
jgi:hypothetical protein